MFLNYYLGKTYYLLSMLHKANWIHFSEEAESSTLANDNEL